VSARTGADIVGGMTLAYDVAGAGPTVVLLHSSVCDRTMWDPQWQVLIDAGYRVVRCDFRGHGGTPAPVRPFNPAEDVRDLLDALGVDRAALVGASYGGRVAQEVAARWPDRVCALGLLCAATRLHPPTADIEAYGRREDELVEAGDLAGAAAFTVDTFVGPAATDRTRAEVARMQRRAYEIQLAVGDDLADPDDRDYDLTAVTAPTLVVSGAHDLQYFRGVADLLAATIPGATREELAWAGHLPSVEDPARTNPLVLGLLSKARFDV
jgi:3-oxoadipate enol-lactonase